MAKNCQKSLKMVKIWQILLRKTKKIGRIYENSPKWPKMAKKWPKWPKNDQK